MSTSAVCVGGTPAVAASANNDELLLKVAYLYNFAKFTRWDETAAGESLYLCTAGHDSLAESLQRLAGKLVGKRRIVVRSWGGNTAAACNILYIASSESADYKRYLATPHHRHLLTVSEIAGFAASGGMIELFKEAERIRFRINVSRVAEGGLVLSSRLLNLAQIVGGGPR